MVVSQPWNRPNRLAYLRRSALADNDIDFAVLGVRWKARMRMRIGEYGNRRRDTLPYPVYVTNSKHWSPVVRDPSHAKSLYPKISKRT